MGIRLGMGVEQAEAAVARPRGAAIPSVNAAQEQWAAWKNVDILTFPFIAILIGGGFVFICALTVGDWGYWMDWRDRRWWPLVTPCLLLTVPAVFTYLMWRYFKLPVAATSIAVGYWLSQMISRWINFHVYTSFPMNFVMPDVWIGAAVMLDAVLIVSRSMVVSGLAGGFMFGLTFYTMNVPLIAPMHMPIQLEGNIITVADYMGFEYLRTSMPEYVRIIESGTLRTFGGHVAPVTAFVAGFFCILIYYIFTWLGSLASKPKWLDKVV